MKKYFVTGLVFLLPLAVTIAIIAFIVNFLTKPFEGFVSSVLSQFDFANQGILFLSSDQTKRYLAKLLILTCLFFFTIGLGVVTRWFAIEALFKLGDRILKRIPVVNTVYKTSQDIIHTLLKSDKKSFKQVVMVPFPKEGMYALGLISRESPAMCSDAVNRELISVLIPTTPNPTTGFLLMYPKKDIIHVDIKPEDAIKYIVSCGVIVPEKPK